MKDFDIQFWIDRMNELRTTSDHYFHSDELREMLRRMGYEIRQHKDVYEVVKKF